MPFGAALLATGANPIHLPIPGADLPHVHYLRSVADSRAIIAVLGEGKRAVVIGASFIGLEVAGSLRNRGIEVDVAAPDSHLFEKVFGADVGDFVQKLHESNGVRFHLGHAVTGITSQGVELDDGTRLPADLVVVGIGVRPDTALAESAGLSVDHGVLVDETLQTSTPGIYAAGDIARYPDSRSGKRVRIEHWVVAQRQGQTAAKNILGSADKYTDPAFFWSQHYDVQLSYVGHAEPWTRYEIEGRLDDRDCKITYFEGDREAAVLTISRDQESLRVEAAWESA